MEQQEVESQLAEAAAEVLTSAMAVKAQTPTPVRIQALALVIGRNEQGQDTIATVTILDISQRVASLKFAIKKLNGQAFIFLYDGFITNEEGQRTDALLLITGTIWGTFAASATPYKHAGLGSVFDPALDVPDGPVVEAYRGVFAA